MDIKVGDYVLLNNGLKLKITSFGIGAASHVGRGWSWTSNVRWHSFGIKDIVKVIDYKESMTK